MYEYTYTHIVCQGCGNDEIATAACGCLAMTRGENICGILTGVKDTIAFEDFGKIDLRVGEVEEAENLENSEKLIRLTVDFGPPSPEATEGKITKTILTGLRQWYMPDYFKGGYFVFVLNLEPKEMAGETSEGMLLCVDGEQPLPVKAPTGSRAGDTLK